MSLCERCTTPSDWCHATTLNTAFLQAIHVTKETVGQHIGKNDPDEAIRQLRQIWQLIRIANDSASQKPGCRKTPKFTEALQQAESQAAYLFSINGYTYRTVAELERANGFHPGSKIIFRSKIAEDFNNPQVIFSAKSDDIHARGLSGGIDFPNRDEIQRDAAIEHAEHIAHGK